MPEKQSLIRSPLFRLAAAGGVLLLLLLHAGSVIAWTQRLMHTLRPLLLGVLFAGMLNPSYERLRTDFGVFSQKHGHDPKARWIKTVSLIGALLPPLLTLAAIICVLIPQLAQSVRLFSEHLDFYSGNFSAWLTRFSETGIGRLLPKGQAEALLRAFQERLPALLRKTYDYTASAVEVLLDLGIGTVFSLYLLADRHRLSAQFRTVCTRLAGKQRTARITAQARRVCSTFARFLSSQCKEALMLGALCWLGMTLLHFPYPVLISVIIGVTNIVPYIGPLAGTVPAVLLLLLIQPRSAVWFVVFIVVLQQLESNLIYPRVVGSSVGLPPAWVLAAIVICGGLWGAGGMLLGVPLASVLYAVLFPEEA